MTIRTLAESYDLPSHEVERLLMVVTGADRAGLAAVCQLDPARMQLFVELAARRKAGEPLQYLEGTVQFGPVEVAVDRRVLIPRPETEYLLELAAQVVSKPRAIVDLCTGSGNLAVALKHDFPEASVFATDRSADALAVARSNSSRLGLDIEFREGDLFAPLPTELRGTADLVVANPPYVSATEFERLPPEVRDFEPRQALVAGPTGDEVLRRIAAEVAGWLRSGGWVFCEIGETQGEGALDLFAAELDAELRLDLTKKPRYVIGRRP